MKLENLHVGMRVKHPHLGLGTVKTIAEHSAQVQFNEGVRTVEPETSGLSPAEAQLAVSGMEMPLEQFIQSTIRKVLLELGLEKPDEVVQQLGARWHGGRVVLHPADPGLQPKEVPLEVFFHKVVMVRNNLRVLEQKINSHPALSEADKVEMQQYISRCYGSLTTFNLLFKDRQDQFGSNS